ncbi:hypothetical protein J3E61_006767 [Mycobacterium sp. OAE908]
MGGRDEGVYRTRFADRNAALGGLPFGGDTRAVNRDRVSLAFVAGKVGRLPVGKRNRYIAGLIAASPAQAVLLAVDALIRFGSTVPRAKTPPQM